MTVLENLLVAQHQHINNSLLAGLFKTPSYRKSEQDALDNAVYWLKKKYVYWMTPTVKQAP